MTALDGGNGVTGSSDRSFRDLAGVRIASCLARDCAKAKPLSLVVAGGLETAIVEYEAFGLVELDIEFAVIGAIQRVGDCTAGGLTVDSGSDTPLVSQSPCRRFLGRSRSFLELRETRPCELTQSIIGHSVAILSRAARNQALRAAYVARAGLFLASPSAQDVRHRKGSF